MAPNEQFNSSTEISTAISLVVLQFNQGFEKSYEDLHPCKRQHEEHMARYRQGENKTE